MEGLKIYIWDEEISRPQKKIANKRERSCNLASISDGLWRKHIIISKNVARSERLQSDINNKRKEC